jgi:heme-degrading monooxygenase HmoA
MTAALEGRGPHTPETSGMFVVIFEVTPRADRKDEYLKLAQHLKPMVEAIDGFLDVERFASRSGEGRLLSLSTWRDEEAVIRWRSQVEHRRVQAYGRTHVFADYRLRVGEVASSGADPGASGADATTARNRQIVTVAEIMLEGLMADSASSEEVGFPPATRGLIDQESFASIYTPGKLVHLASWQDAAAARRSGPIRHPGLARQLDIRVIRDYGLVDRAQAPQRYPAPRLARA